MFTTPCSLFLYSVSFFLILSTVVSHPFHLSLRSWPPLPCVEDPHRFLIVKPVPLPLSFLPFVTTLVELFTYRNNNLLLLYYRRGGLNREGTNSGNGRFLPFFLSPIHSSKLVLFVLCLAFPIHPSIHPPGVLLVLFVFPLSISTFSWLIL